MSCRASRRERKAIEAIFARQTRERLWSEPFVVPVPGTATSSFGRRTILNGQPRGPHTGTDFQAATGTPVVAPNRGRIALAADQYFPGKTIIIDHGLGVYSYLAHLSEFTAAEGTMVERGQRIALLRRDRPRHRPAPALDDALRQRAGRSAVAGGRCLRTVTSEMALGQARSSPQLPARRGWSRTLNRRRRRDS